MSPSLISKLAQSGAPTAQERTIHVGTRANISRLLLAVLAKTAAIKQLKQF